MVERVFMEVTVPFKTPNSGDVGREVGWPLASLEIVSCDRIVACEISSLKLLTRLSSMLVFRWCLVT